MTDPVDDLEAIRTVVKALEPFGPEDRERIIRWASEKLGMATHAAINVPTKPVEPASRIPAPSDPTPLAATTAKDICSFIATKQPRSDNQLAAVVAYFYHFEAPEAERKDSIGKEELVDACRKSDRNRPARPAQVLVNAYHSGLLDKAGSPGKYRLNSVGENLVAMVLPDQNNAERQVARKLRHPAQKRPSKKSGKRRSTGPKAK